MKNKRTGIFFFSVGLFVAELCPFFDDFLTFAIISLWNLVNKISGELLELGYVWQNSINIWLNYLPFPTLAFCTVKQSCQQSI